MGFFRKRDAAETVTADDVLAALGKVMDPELGRDLVSLNMVRNVAVSEGNVSLDLVLTTNSGFGGNNTALVLRRFAPGQAG